ncbi:hypothetical protein NJ76_04710 [Rhodococcus sp. IITR03]|nr:hypothetical protein NJ76_04710 [Rhodococcus sp. IITR03]
MPSLTRGSVVLHLTGYDDLFIGDALERDLSSNSLLSTHLSSNVRVHPGHGDSYEFGGAVASPAIRLVPQYA